MTSERTTITKANTVVINTETAYVQKLIDESNSIAGLGVEPTKLLKEMEKESKRLNPSGHTDEEEDIIRQLNRKKKK